MGDQNKDLIERGKELLKNADPAAVTCFEEAVKNGNEKANYYLATIYRFGKGADVDMKKAVDLYKKAAKAGSRMALYQLGKLSEKGKGVKKSKEEAKKYYLQSAELGYGKAMLEIAQILEKEYEVAKVREENNNKKTLKQIIDNKGNTDGLVYSIESTISNEEAVKWYKKLAEKGDENIKIHLAGIYEIGKGIVKDEEEADRIYKEVAEAGNEKIMLKLAKKYQIRNQGNDAEEALYWYKKLFEAGDNKAPLQIALMYEEEAKDLDKDSDEAKAKVKIAREWYQKAADAGNHEAKHKLMNVRDEPVTYIVGQEITNDKRNPRD